MQNNKQITCEKQKIELVALITVLSTLTKESRALLHEHAPLLLDALDKINPENTHYGQIAYSTRS